MDPNATLEQIRDEIRVLRDDAQDMPMSEGDMAERAEKIADLFEGLDRWLTSGGLLPKAWSWL